MLYGNKIWGPKAWNLLHAFSINNLLEISNKKKHYYYIFYTSFIYILPCIICSKHYSDIIYYINPLIESEITREYLIEWVYNTHNIVNEVLDKELYPYENLDKKYIINNDDIFFILKLTYLNIDFTNISLFNYDQIYNFFLYFCLLYPNLKIKKKLKKIIRSVEFKKIETPNQFNNWFKTIFIKKIKSFEI